MESVHRNQVDVRQRLLNTFLLYALVIRTLVSWLEHFVVVDENRLVETECRCATVSSISGLSCASSDRGCRRRRFRRDRDVRRI